MIEYDNLQKVNEKLFNKYQNNFNVFIKSGWYILGNQVSKFEENFAILPNSLAITYALGICTGGDSKRIFLIGLDGYTQNNPKKFVMDELFQNYKLENKAKKIFSLTPTNYKIKVIKKI